MNQIIRGQRWSLGLAGGLFIVPALLVSNMTLSIADSKMYQDMTGQDVFTIKMIPVLLEKTF